MYISFDSRKGNPLQCSRLENPRDGGAWYAAVHGVPKSQIGLCYRSFPRVLLLLLLSRFGRVRLCTIP